MTESGRPLGNLRGLRPLAAHTPSRRFVRRFGRGQVLAQVMIMSIIMMFLATVLVRITMHEAVVAAKIQDSAVVSAYGQTIINSVIGAWAANGGQYCTGFDWMYGGTPGRTFVTCTNSGSGTCGSANNSQGFSGTCACDVWIYDPTTSQAKPYTNTTISTSQGNITFGQAKTTTVSGDCQLQITGTF